MHGLHTKPWLLICSKVRNRNYIFDLSPRSYMNNDANAEFLLLRFLILIVTFYFRMCYLNIQKAIPHVNVIPVIFPVNPESIEVLPYKQILIQIFI